VVDYSGLDGQAGQNGQTGLPGSAGNSGNGNLGGFGAGKGADNGGAGGAGLGAGGDIFIAQGGKLILDGALISNGATDPLMSGGSAQGAGTGDQQSDGFGQGVFLQGGTINKPTTLALGAPTGQTVTVSDEISDQPGSLPGATGAGALVIEGPGIVDLTAKNSFIGGVAIDGGTLELGHTGAAGSGPIVFHNDPSLEFTPGDAPNNPIEGFVAGDTIVIDDFIANAKTYAGSTLTLTGVENGAPTTVLIDLPGHSISDLVYSDNTLTGSTTLTTNVPCFARGARILTDRGEVRVENLAVGDLVVTASGQARPIRWLGRRTVDCLRHVSPHAVWPYRVRAGAFGDGAPLRDLWLSPGHSVACAGVLIPISALENGVSVAQVECAEIEYWHVELDAHDVILAEGLPAESYLDTGNRADFANGDAFTQAHPDFAPRHWADACLPLMLEGPAVVAAKIRLLARLAERGCAMTPEADARVLVDGLRVEPIRLSPTRLAFALPSGGREIVLTSRTFVPGHAVAGSNDPRELGLCVGALQIDGAGIALDDDGGCGAGWREVEFNKGRFTHRWTTGLTPLPAGARIVVIDLVGVGSYWATPKARGVVLTA
jgi:autotransporter-associated beta strand protein